MKIRNTFLLAVLLLIFNKVQAKRASLNSLIEELAPIARLTNGIAIETELSADANKMNDVVAEFLRVGSGDDVAKLKELRVDEVAKELGELYATVEKVPELNVDMAALADTFKALETMKHGSKVLDNKNLTDPSDELRKDIDEAKQNLDPAKFTEFDHYETAALKLKEIRLESFDLAGKIVDGYLKPLKKAVSNVREQLQRFVTFEQTLALLFKLADIDERLKDVRDITTISNTLTENFGTFSSMDVKLTELKTGVNNLKLVTTDLETMPTLGKSINESSDLVKKLTSETPTLKMTVGFSGGIDDLKLMVEDLKSGKLKRLVSQGKDTKDLQKSLISVLNIHGQLEVVYKVWLQLVAAEKDASSEDVTKILSDLSASAQNEQASTKLAGSLDSISKCFKDLNLPGTVSDKDKVTALLTYSTRLSNGISAFRKILETKKADFEEFLKKFIPLSTALVPVEENSGILITRGIWEGIQKNNDTEDIINSLNAFHSALKPTLDQNPFKTLHEVVDLNVIPTVLGSLNGTNVDVMLACLQKTSYNSAELDSTLSFAKTVQVMKRKKTEFNSTQTFLAELSSVTKELLKIDKVTKATQTPTLRRRRAPNQKSLANLKNAPTVATDLGKGVQVLREFAKILENEASVQVAVNADDGLKNAISAIPGVQSVWTDENRKGMGKMVVDLKELDKFAGRMSVESIKSFGKIFEEAGKVRGVEIDAKLFDDPISKALFSNFNWNVYPYHQTFHSLKDLKLNFTQHHEHLKAASLTLDPLQKFFDEFFEIDRSVKEEEGLSTVTLIIIVCASIVGVILLVLLVKFLVGRWQGRRD